VIIIGLKTTFWEAALAVKDALFELGYESDIYIYPNQFRADEIEYTDVNVFLHGHRVEPNSNCMNILIQTEQLHSRCHFDGHGKWTRVLDCFEEQASHDNTRYFPLGYSRRFDTTTRAKEMRDFYFFGSPTPYRMQFCHQHGIHFVPKTYSEARDRFIMSSRINVNLRPWSEKYYYAPLHGLLVMCKGKFYMQEVVEGGYGIYRECVVDFSTENFIDVATEWKNRDREQHAMSVRDNLMKNHGFEHYFAEAVRGLLC
jgi:hypothetical protein